MMHTAEVEHLTKIYGEHIAAQDLSFVLDKGQIYGFLGLNGAGKTTTMHMMTGALSPDEGTVWIAGHDLAKEPEQAKKHIGYLPEVPPLYPDMTVREYLEFSAELKGMPREERKARTEHLLKTLSLTEYEHKLIRTLSKGYRQRTGLAQALIASPDLLILDEPMSGLDPRQITEMREIIREYAKDHAVFLSSHILAEIGDLCGYLFIIKEGVLTGEGTPEALKKKTGLSTLEEVFLTLTEQTDDTATGHNAAGNGRQAEER